MLLLGKKYELTMLEKKRIKNKFSNCIYIEYSGDDSDLCVDRINHEISNNTFKLLILNTDSRVPNDIIEFLTIQQITNNITIITIEHFLERYLNKCYIPSNQEDLHYLEDIRTYSTLQFIQKRTIDIIFCPLISLILLPSLYICYYKIKKQSPGPIFYRQKRVGKGNAEFYCVKYRSMQLDAEKGGAQFSSKDDPRVFSWGKFMRKSRLDELPQMWNILRGEMHLVGPRPERRCWTDEFQKTIPYYAERHIVSPGITGWAQVMYPYGENKSDAKQKLMYDLYYLKYWNIGLELKIIWKTVKVVLKGDGH